MIKLNKLELDLLRKAIGWYYKQFGDKELRAAIVKEKPTKDDLERMKDAVDLYHRKGFVNAEQHKIMRSLYDKFGENIKSTNERLIEERKKAKLKALKEQEEQERKEKERLKKLEREERKKTEADIKKREAEQTELEKDQYKFSDLFTDITPEKE